MLSLKVPKISCGGCAASIEKAVRSVDQTATINVDIAAKRVEINSTIDAATIAAAIKGVGYETTAA